jgi:hypothetical protein
MRRVHETRHSSKVRLPTDRTRELEALVNARGWHPTIRALGTSACTLDKALHGLAMLAETAARLDEAIQREAAR